MTLIQILALAILRQNTRRYGLPCLGCFAVSLYLICSRDAIQGKSNPASNDRLLTESSAQLLEVRTICDGLNYSLELRLIVPITTVELLSLLFALCYSLH